jgi:adenylate cyclase
VAADVAGYSRLVAADEEGALRHLATHLREVVDPAMDEYGGRIFKTTGDGFLAEFASVVAALRCSLKIQDGVAERNRPVLPEHRLEFRIAVHMADVVVASDDDILGDGVNVAARLESLALPGGVCISGRVHEDVAGRVEVEFYDLGEQPLKNMPRPVRVFRVLLPGSDRLEVRSSLPLPAKPSIAVLPFLNMSGDPEQEYFADALTDDIVTALSRWRWFFVIARDSSFAYKGQKVDAARVGEELGVRYILEGSVRKAGSRVRVNAQLIDASTGVHVWADTLDRNMVDIFQLQDELTEQVVGAIEPAMLQSEGARLSRKNPGDLTAFDCFQRGMWHFNKTTEEGFEAALGLFRQAVDRDPELSQGYVGLARTLYGRALYGWSPNRQAEFEEALEAAEIAIRLDPRDAIAYYAFAGAALYLNRQDDALDAARKAVALNPNFAYGHVRVGQVLSLLGRAGEAVAPIEKAIRRNPYDPQLGVILGTLSLACYLAGDYEASVRYAKSAHSSNYRGAASIVAAGLAQLGRTDEAIELLGRPVFQKVVGHMPRLVAQAREDDRQHLWQGLRMAARALEGSETAS